ncbi:hypothetical protein AB0M94_06030 [Streptomyces xanthochromogenes]|nr:MULTISPECIES: hypothetical protein [Streptomyces]
MFGLPGSLTRPTALRHSGDSVRVVPAAAGPLRTGPSYPQQ